VFRPQSDNVTLESAGAGLAIAEGTVASIAARQSAPATPPEGGLIVEIELPLE